MRPKPSRIALLLVVAALALGPLVACEKEPGYYFDDGEANRLETTTGEDLNLGVGEYHFRNTGCACDAKEERSALTTSVDYSVEPAEGATVSENGVFTATRPGTYTVMVSGQYGSATTTVVVTGEQLPEEDGPPLESEEPEQSPFEGSWSYSDWWAQQVGGGASEDAWEWVPGKQPAVFTITFVDGAPVMTGWAAGPVTIEGDTIHTVYDVPGWHVELQGTIAGDTITGTQSYVDENAGAFSSEWVATHVQ